jgi:hypothetical protein
VDPVLVSPYWVPLLGTLYGEPLIGDPLSGIPNGDTCRRPHAGDPLQGHPSGDHLDGNHTLNPHLETAKGVPLHGTLTR